MFDGTFGIYLHQKVQQTLYLMPNQCIHKPTQFLGCTWILSNVSQIILLILGGCTTKFYGKLEGLRPPTVASQWYSSIFFVDGVGVILSCSTSNSAKTISIEQTLVMFITQQKWIADQTSKTVNRSNNDLCAILLVWSKSHPGLHIKPYSVLYHAELNSKNSYNQSADSMMAM